MIIEEYIENSLNKYDFPIKHKFYDGKPILPILK